MRKASRAGKRRSVYIRMALVMTLGVAAGVAMFIATLRSGPATQVTGRDTLAALSELVDQQGRPFDAAKIQGRYAVLYFGFTFCPDACPLALSNLTVALRQLDPEAEKIESVFISVDPVRDTPEKLNEYLAHFSSRIIGLTGSVQAIQAAEQSFGVIALEHNDANLPGGYTVDHSNDFIVLSPSGRVLMRVPANLSADELLAQLRTLVPVVEAIQPQARLHVSLAS
jgi:protein SCO1/2